VVTRVGTRGPAVVRLDSGTSDVSTNMETRLNTVVNSSNMRRSQAVRAWFLASQRLKGLAGSKDSGGEEQGGVGGSRDDLDARRADADEDTHKNEVQNSGQAESCEVGATKSRGGMFGRRRNVDNGPETSGSTALSSAQHDTEAGAPAARSDSAKKHMRMFPSRLKNSDDLDSSDQPDITAGRHHGTFRRPGTASEDNSFSFGNAPGRVGINARGFHSHRDSARVSVNFSESVKVILFRPKRKKKKKKAEGGVDDETVPEDCGSGHLDASGVESKLERDLQLDSTDVLSFESPSFVRRRAESLT